jgi:hypothetical protein
LIACTIASTSIDMHSILDDMESVSSSHSEVSEMIKRCCGNDQILPMMWLPMRSIFFYQHSALMFEAFAR